MKLAESQKEILGHLKKHGPQSVKVLARRLAMTTMGARQHLHELQSLRLVNTTHEARQTRGRPLRLWRLTAEGHHTFADSHREASLELIQTIREELGHTTLDDLIDKRSDKVEKRYRLALQDNPELQNRLQSLAQLRSDDGYMAEIRLLPDQNWLLIENHCPICTLAENCSRFCDAELELFKNLLAEQALVQRVDHLLAGARRCAYKVSRKAS